MKKEKAQYLTIFFGCLLAVAIVCSQLMSYQVSAFQSKKISKTEQTESKTDGKETACIGLPSFSLPSPVHLQINFDSHFLFDIVLEDSNQEERSSSESSPISQKFLTTLFRVIIAPNAP
jgi:hypothetical protein